MGGNYTKSLYNDYEKLSNEYAGLLEKMKLYKNEHILLEQETRLNRKLEQELEEKNAEIEALKKEILRLNGFLNIDGNNSGASTRKKQAQIQEKKQKNI